MSASRVQDPLPPLALGAACPICQAENRPDRQFCAACGARLWDPCVRCAQINAACEKHCGRCGVNLADELLKVQTAAAAELSEAAALAEVSRHGEAAERLAIPWHVSARRHHA